MGGGEPPLSDVSPLVRPFEYAIKIAPCLHWASMKSLRSKPLNVEQKKIVGGYGSALSQESGYIKSPCFICLWDSRAKQLHWKQDVWSSRKYLTVGRANALKKSLANRDEITLPSLHIKLHTLTHTRARVKTRDRDGEREKAAAAPRPLPPLGRGLHGLLTNPGLHRPKQLGFWKGKGSN
ncbi:hypothetical protein EVAR_45496_1 [Eumeta japonica]|uniref:Uncharacterized protein n=1 Tax=Eumeta variegata TaxID=151549 RepID=A0A4C1WFA7_EUMVA|nr:hypothetical protein EVAR_45496_1 [Eumeta japonica]